MEAARTDCCAEAAAPFLILQVHFAGLPDWFREAEVELFKGLDHDAGHAEIAIPLAIGGHDIPRGMAGGGFLDKVFVNLHKILPARPVLEVVGIEFPMLVGIIEARLQALLLLVLRDMEENFYNGGALVRQHALEVDDVLIALFPDLLEFLSVYRLSILCPSINTEAGDPTGAQGQIAEGGEILPETWTEVEDVPVPYDPVSDTVVE